MSQNFENTQKIKVSKLSSNQTYNVSLALTADDIAELREELGLQALRKTSFAGELTPSGQVDWALNGKLGATAVQTCGVTLEPVTTRVDLVVERIFLKDMPEFSDAEEEVEMPEDERVEALGQEISLLDVFREALVLELPTYPRAEGAQIAQTDFTEPGSTPMTDADALPFASLAALKDKMQQNDD